MPERSDADDVQDALRHCRAGLKALEAAHDGALQGQIYPTHVHLAAVELAEAIALSMKVALRAQ